MLKVNEDSTLTKLLETEIDLFGKFQLTKGNNKPSKMKRSIQVEDNIKKKIIQLDSEEIYLQNE